MGSACFLLTEQNLTDGGPDGAHIGNDHQSGQHDLKEDPSADFQDHDKCLCQQNEGVKQQTHRVKVHRHKSSGVDDTQQENNEVAQEGCKCSTVDAENRDEKEVEYNVDDSAHTGGDKVEHTLFLHHIDTAQEGGHAGEDGRDQQQRDIFPGGIKGIGGQQQDNHLGKEDEPRGGGADQ